MNDGGGRRNDEDVADGGEDTKYLDEIAVDGDTDRETTAGAVVVEFARRVDVVVVAHEQPDTVQFLVDDRVVDRPFSLYLQQDSDLPVS